MPYIPEAKRKEFDEHIDKLLLRVARSGEMNYIITRLLDGYAHVVTGVNYDGLNEIAGIMECVRSEFYRRVIVPYEDLKMSQNGDVYGGPK